MKTNKVIIETKDWTKTITFKETYDMSEQEWIAELSRIALRVKILNIYDGNTHHICKYCGEVAKGTDEDILCEDCRDIFGHAFYSEL